MPDTPEIQSGESTIQEAATAAVCTAPTPAALDRATDRITRELERMQEANGDAAEVVRLSVHTTSSGTSVSGRMGESVGTWTVDEHGNIGRMVERCRDCSRLIASEPERDYCAPCLRANIGPLDPSNRIDAATLEEIERFAKRDRDAVREASSVVLVHLNVTVPPDDDRSAEQIADAIEDAIHVGSDNPDAEYLTVVVAMAEKIDDGAHVRDNDSHQPDPRD